MVAIYFNNTLEKVENATCYNFIKSEPLLSLLPSGSMPVLPVLLVGVVVSAEGAGVAAARTTAEDLH